MNPVVAHFQRREPGVIPFSLLQFEQVSAGILANAAKLIEFCVVPLGDDPAVADQYRGIVDNGLREERRQLRIIGEGGGELS